MDVKTHIERSIECKNLILNDRNLMEAIKALGEKIGQTLSDGGLIIFAGNGGSFADSQHLVAEFTSKLLVPRGPLNAIALGTNSSSMSAIGNDYGFEQVFGRELLAVSKIGDLFIPISTSGNSKNILAAIGVAKKIGLHVEGLTGSTGGTMAEIIDCIKIPSDNTAVIQECHIMVGHILCSIAETGYLEN